MAEKAVRIEGMFPSGTALPVAQAAPAASSAPASSTILSGSVTTSGTVISIAANKVWYGYFGLSATLTGSAKTAVVTVQTVDGGAVPAPSVDLISMNLVTTALTDSVHGDGRTNYIYIHGGTSGTDISATVTGDPSSLSATAYGYVLA